MGSGVGTGGAAARTDNVFGSEGVDHVGQVLVLEDERDLAMRTEWGKARTLAQDAHISATLRATFYLVRGVAAAVLQMRVAACTPMGTRRRAPAVSSARTRRCERSRRIRTAPQQQVGTVGKALGRANVEGGVASLVDGVDVGAVLEEQLGDLDRALHARQVQLGAQCRVHNADGRPGLQKDLHTARFGCMIANEYVDGDRSGHAMDKATSNGHDKISAIVSVFSAPILHSLTPYQHCKRRRAASSWPCRARAARHPAEGGSAKATKREASAFPRFSPTRSAPYPICSLCICTWLHVR